MIIRIEPARCSLEGIYFNVNLILVLISVILTVVVLNFHYRGPKKSRVPYWCRRFVMAKVGYWLGFRFISREQLLSQNPASNSTPSARFLAERTSIRENSNGDVNRSRSHVKVKFPPMSTAKTSTAATATITTATTTTMATIMTPGHDEHTDESRAGTTREHVLTHSIEQILLKMQTQFDPSRIDDEQLKVSILREILECQRLLLTIHARKQRNQANLTFDVYEEWKILAIIVDRICFIFYLISMLAASIIFFIREPILRRNG